MLIIPNLMMPECCIECPCESESHCTALWYLGEKDNGIVNYRERRKDCPLVEKKPGIRILKNRWR